MTSVVALFYFGDKMNRDFEINKRIRTLRKLRDLTQAETANILGMKLSTYSQMERKGNIPASVLKRIAEIFNTDIYYILYGKEKSENLITSLSVNNCRFKENNNRVLRYSFLEDISDTELNQLKKTVFYLKPKQRLKVYEYAYKIVIKKS